MNEIEKLYDNTGIFKFLQCDYYKIYKKYCYENNCDNCQKDVNLRKIYPLFTAEKQIELIKWLSSKYGIYIVDKYSIGFGECIGDFCIKENFEEALAESINHLWQSLTEQEKTSIKNILEM